MNTEFTRKQYKETNGELIRRIDMTLDGEETQHFALIRKLDARSAI